MVSRDILGGGNSLCESPEANKSAAKWVVPRAEETRRKADSWLPLDTTSLLLPARLEFSVLSPCQLMSTQALGSARTLSLPKASPTRGVEATCLLMLHSLEQFLREYLLLPSGVAGSVTALLT